MPDPTFEAIPRPFDEWQTSDLPSLRDVAEGWFVEYKRELISQRAIAKSISSFANTYGGYLFFGIEEGEARCAGSAPGILITAVPETEVRIRQAVSALLFPPPFYRTKILIGPESTLSLPADRAVLVIQVPRSLEAPHVHGDGRIYRRVADESDPKAETDRHTLDMLWQRRREEQTLLRERLTAPVQVSMAEERVSFIDLYILPDIFGDRIATRVIDFSEFAELMRDRSTESGGLPFDNLFSMANGLVARQVGAYDPSITLFTWKQYFSGHSVVTLPLYAVDAEDAQDEDAPLDGSEHADAFLSLLSTSDIEIINLSQMWNAFGAILIRHSKLMALAGLNPPFYAKLRLRNVWRRVPFLNAPSYVEFVRCNGLPVCQDVDVLSPPGFDEGDFITLKGPDDSSDWLPSNMIALFIELCGALGLPGLPPEKWSSLMYGF